MNELDFSQVEESALPTGCPICGQTIRVSPHIYRRSRWARPAKVLLFLGCLISSLLLLVSLAYAGEAAASLGKEFDLHRRESGLLVFVIYIVLFPVALVPAYICARKASRMPRLRLVRCGECEWMGEVSGDSGRLNS